MNTTTKIQARILRSIEANPTETLTVSVRKAAWEAVQEAKGLGWSDRTIAGMVQTFINVAADMVTEFAAQAA